MKKLVFGLIATVMVSSFGFGQKEIKFSDYGFYHNEVLALLETNKTVWKDLDNNHTIDYISELMETKYPEKFSNVDLTNAKKLFEGYKSNKFNFDNFISVWDLHKERYKLSKKVITVIDKVILDNLTYEQTLNEILIFKESVGLTTNELNSLTAMESVLKSSYSYWTDYHNVTSLEGRGGWVADIAIALIFVECPPLSILASGLTSKFCDLNP